MVPLPPGLHEDSNELFGFFTYEIRVGHDRYKGWSTAQGRFGAVLRVTGIKQLAPNLYPFSHSRFKRNNSERSIYQPSL